MFTMDHSSSASSPFSQRSTDPSSPEANTNANGEGLTAAQKAAAISAGFPAGVPGGMAGTMGLDGLMKSLPQTATPEYPLPQTAAAGPSIPSRPTRTPPSSTLKSFTPVSAPPSARGSSSRNVSAAPSLNGASVASGGAGGSRSEPPRRNMEVEGLPVTPYTVDQVASYPDSNRLLMQGDPQHINKQRVETAIRVILDLLRAIPASPSSPLPSPVLAALLPVDPSMSTRWTFDRIGTFRALRLQAGTTTKATSKKQLQAGPLPKEQVAYLETSVYMSGENGKRVYACKRCRLRETRRREHKDAARKKQAANASGSDSSSSGQSKATRSILPPTPDYITGENAEQYDPHRNGQVVEEPIWDPVHADWRHEIVLFNSAPEVAIKDGSCNWLPFRVICYGKCHGEKVGFTIKFTIRTYDGRVVASAYSDPIRITDDHKTDTKVKPRDTLSATSGGAAPAAAAAKPAARPRKGRASAASSRRQSPAPSEGGESVHSVVSEVGAVFQRQTPNVRGNKPYSRPPSLPPSGPPAPTGPYDFLQTGIIPGEPSFLPRTASGTSIPTVASMSALPVTSTDMTGGNRWSRASSAEYPVYDQSPVMPVGVAGTVSPNQLRRPNFGFTALDGNPQIPVSSAPASTSSSAVASPIAGLRPLSNEELFMNDLNSQLNVLNPYTSFNALDISPNGLVPNHNPMLYESSPDIDMAALNTGFEGLLDRSGTASLASSYDGSAFGADGFGDRSDTLFSESGVVPESDNMENFLDFSAGETAQDLRAPFGGMGMGVPGGVGLGQMSPPGGAEIPPLPFDFLHSNSPMSVMSPGAFAGSPAAAMGQQAVGPQATVTHVIPAEGPVAGGITVAIAGTAFTPASVILFGTRVAKTTFVSEGFVQCVLPASTMAGTVEVAVQGSIRGLGIASQTFTYTGMDKEIMRLALEVRDQYQGASSDAAYRLAAHVTNKSNSNSDWSDRGSMSPGGASPFDADAVNPLSRQTSKSISSHDAPTDLQATLIGFLASLDQHAPGSLRRSGAVNHRNAAAQTLLHLSTVMGFHRLARRLIFIGAHLDLQDCNGFTALALASLCGQASVARVLIEAGAAYDRPTSYGEMPLDLAKTGEHAEVEALLLSAVWSTSPRGPTDRVSTALSSLPSVADGSEIDDDNPSSGSSSSGSEVSRSLRPARKSRKARGKQRAPVPLPLPVGLRRNASTASLDATPLATPSIGAMASPPEDDPPPYDGPPKPSPAEAAAAGQEAGWMSRTFSTISNPVPGLPDGLIQRLPIPSLWPSDPSAGGEKQQGQQPPQGWVAFPAPSWETLQKMASPEEVKLFTQAMAAAALNAVVQSTSASTSPIMPTREVSRGRDGKGRRKSRQNSRSEDTRAVVKPVKHDRMLYLFWLPILLFVGFWLLVTALPIATGFCLIYARQITRVIREKVKV